MKLSLLSLLPLGAALLGSSAFATNPLIKNQFTADPTARVFEGKVYLYPSHDIPAPPGHGRPGWFCMQDYHVFSSSNLMDWTDYGAIVSQEKVPWVDAKTYSMWAPDCVTKNGKYYFFFPALAKGTQRGFRIGVAIADKPEGPFQPQPTPIAGVSGIDPCVLIDRDGRAYLYYAMRSKLFVAKLTDSLLELDGAPQQIANLPPKGLTEGPFVFERNGIYYLTYPHVEHTIERLEYATGKSPLGPFTPAGVILDESPDGCWTVHQSIVEYQGQWYLFYHDKDLSPNFDKHRSARADRLYFNEDGTIQKVIRTLRGVGIADARSRIQIDRYSAIGGDVEDSFIDPANPFEGWKISLRGRSWVRFNEVDFGKGDEKTVALRATSTAGDTIEVRVDKPDGPLIAHVVIPAGAKWSEIWSSTQAIPAGVHDLFVSQPGATQVDLDWLRFE